MGAYRQSSLRVLAPASLVVFAIAFLVVVVASLNGGGSGASDAERVQVSKPETRQAARKTETRKPNRQRSGGARFYTVRSGDTLNSIAAKTAVSVDTLLQLNPSLDPQGLVNGQRLRLPGGSLKKGATGASGASGATGPE
jgi:Tfp pilus assembly protein FimV